MQLIRSCGYSAMGLALVFGLGCRAATAGSEVVLGKPVPAGQRVAVESIDHAPWSALLGKYVDSQGMVDYRGWKGSPEDVRPLDRYLQSLSAAQITARSAQPAVLAFWINAYNAVTVRGILREYPTTSIRNHTPKLFGYNIWQDLKLPVGDATYSLEEIEHEQLRKMGEPRIHFAIVCASIGCPPLRNEAYTAARLDEQLADNARAFFAHSRNLRVDASGGTIALSSIMSWFGDDFGATPADQLRSIAPYLPTESARRLATAGNARVSYLDYDWNLNAQQPRR